MSRRATPGIAALLGVSLLATVVFVTRPPHLPPVDAHALLAKVQGAVDDPPSLTGLIDANFDMGLPFDVLPQLRLVVARINGSIRARLWRAPGAYRAAYMEYASEDDVYYTKDEAWEWISTLPASVHRDPADLISMPRDAASGLSLFQGSPSMVDPTNLARAALAADTPDARVTVVGAAWVAGRASRRLVIHPVASTSLARTIELDVDDETSLPLRVSITVDDGTQAIESHYRTFRTGPIPASVFHFTPPDGYPMAPHLTLPTAKSLGISGVRTLGKGLAVAYAVKVPAAFLSRRFDGADSALLRKQFPLNRSLISARLADRAGGSIWILIGTVPQQTLIDWEKTLP